MLSFALAFAASAAEATDRWQVIRTLSIRTGHITFSVGYPDRNVMITASNSAGTAAVIFVPYDWRRFRNGMSDAVSSAFHYLPPDSIKNIAALYDSTGHGLIIGASTNKTGYPNPELPDEERRLNGRVATLDLMFFYKKSSAVPVWFYADEIEGLSSALKDVDRYMPAPEPWLNKELK